MKRFSIIAVLLVLLSQSAIAEASVKPAVSPAISRAKFHRPQFAECRQSQDFQIRRAGRVGARLGAGDRKEIGRRAVSSA